MTDHKDYLNEQYRLAVLDYQTAHKKYVKPLLDK